MTKATACLFLLTCALRAQSVDVAFFRAVLSPANETPPIEGYNAKGVGDVVVHMVKDSSGKITSGSVDFLAHATFPADVTVTGMHIHSGAAGVAGLVTISSGL